MINKLKIMLPGLDEHLQKMMVTEQDPSWHGEVDVYTHTVMVLDEVNKLELPEEDMELLRMIAVLHDIGKPYCTTLEDGHIRSNGHSKRGYHISMKLLDKSNLSKSDIEQIINIIRVHGEPNWILEKKDPEREVINISMMCRIDLLYHFVKCDILGRICDDKETFLINLEYFKEIAIRLNCFDKPYNFYSNISKFNYLIKKTHYHTDQPYNDTKSKVYIVCGLPGSGKDYYIKKNMKLPVISLDEIRKELKIKPTEKQGKVIQTAKERAREYMRKSDDFIWNATNTTKRLRTELISFFTEYNSYINIIYIDKSLKTILEQNKKRNSAVPERVIIRLYDKLEIPTNSEAHELNII